jgi:hypothetical protein
MIFEKHSDLTMGLYYKEVEIRGQQEELLFAFNLAENPELAEAYLAWVAEGNTAEEWTGN